MQPPIVLIVGSHGARMPGEAGVRAPLGGETRGHALANALRSHHGPVTLRPAPTEQDAGEIIMTVPEQLPAVLALGECQSTRTIAFNVPRSQAPELVRDLALAAVIDTVQYRNWLRSDGRSHRARIYGLSEIASRMAANTIPAPGTQDYVLLDHSACRDLPSLIAAYVRELIEAEDMHGGQPQRPADS